MKRFSIVSVMLLIGCGQTSSPVAKVATTPTATTKTVEVTEPARELDSSLLCAMFEGGDESLLGKPIKLDGIVARIGRDKEGDPYIRLLTDPAWELRVYAAASQRLDKFQRGQRITATGNLAQHVGSSINVVDCGIVVTPDDAEKHAASGIGASVNELVRWLESNPGKMKEDTPIVVYGIVEKFNRDPYGNPMCRLVRSSEKAETWVDLEDGYKVKPGDLVVLAGDGAAGRAGTEVDFNMWPSRVLLRSE